jgi:hypothetical protein
MQYVIIGGDGRQYGPVDLAQLKQWVTEGRVTWDSKVRNLDNGMNMKASNMPELDGCFAPTAHQHAAAVSGYMYLKPGARVGMKNPFGEFWTVLGLSIAGGIVSMCLGPFSLPFTLYAVYRAWEAMKDEEKLAGVAFAIAIIALIAALSMSALFIVIWVRGEAKPTPE